MLGGNERAREMMVPELMKFLCPWKVGGRCACVCACVWSGAAGSWCSPSPIHSGFLQDQ